jgi:hypothetical protein
MSTDFDCNSQQREVLSDHYQILIYYIFTKDFHEIFIQHPHPLLLLDDAEVVAEEPQINETERMITEIHHAVIGNA